MTDEMKKLLDLDNVVNAENAELPSGVGGPDYDVVAPLLLQDLRCHYELPEISFDTPKTPDYYQVDITDLHSRENKTYFIDVAKGECVIVPGSVEDV